MFRETDTKNGTKLTNMMSATNVTCLFTSTGACGISIISNNMFRSALNCVPPDCGKVHTNKCVSIINVISSDRAVF